MGKSPNGSKSPLQGRFRAMKLIDARRRKSARLSVLTALIGLLPWAASALPDLIVNLPRAQATIEFHRRAFSPDECAYVEGCVWQSGGRKLLYLDAGILNLGTSDLVLGDPTRRPDLFVWSPCHAHYHLKGLASYRVLAPNGRQVAKTRSEERRVGKEGSDRWMTE